MTVKNSSWDAADYLRSEESIAEYLTAALEDGDPKFIAAALGDIARARGMSKVARESGLAREALYRALSEEGNPTFDTVLRVAKALGIRLVAAPDNKGEAA